MGITANRPGRLMRVILFGATGMVGASVLLECLDDPNVEAVLAVGRKPSGRRHDKLRNLVVPDLADLSGVQDQLAGFDACCYAVGVTAVGTEYARVTYDLTMSAARAVLAASPRVTFCFVSGQGADSSERGRVMWARVKGRTENALLAMPMRTYVFRPGLVRPRKGIGSKTAWYNVFYAVTGPFYPVLLPTLGGYVTTAERLCRAMLAVARNGYPARILESREINRVATGR
jgi:uncharacterized protein YbjT (DUF2867 family)